MRRPIETPFGVVNGVGRGMDVLDEGPRALMEWAVLHFSFPLVKMAYF